MPPPQPHRRRRGPPSAAVSCRMGRRMKDRGRAHHKRGLHIDDTPLADNALACIFARLPNVAAVVRYAATCRRWGRVVATSAAALSRSLPPLGRFVPHLAVGFLHQENDGATARARSAASVSRPQFITTASGGGLFDCRRTSIGSFMDSVGAAGGLLDYSRPVASRNGRLILELQRDGHADGLTFAVCNPMAGDVAVVPPLSGKDKVRDYCCTLLTGEDLKDPPRCPSFFRLLLVYNRRGSTVLRCYSSDTGRRGPEAKSDIKIPSSKLSRIGQAVVLRGVAFWPLDHSTLGVRMDAGDLDRALDTHLLPYYAAYYWPQNCLLGVSPDNRLFLISFGTMGRHLVVAVLSHFEITGDDIRMGRMVRRSAKQIIPLYQIKLASEDTLKLRWFGEKSGVVLFTIGEGSGSGDTLALNLREEVVSKVAGSESDSWRNLVRYEMNVVAYLASIAA